MLLGSQSSVDTDALSSSWAPLRTVAWTASAVFVAIPLVYTYELPFVSSGNSKRSAESAEHLALIGRDSAWARGTVASKLANSGFHKRALEEIDRSLALHPSRETLMLKGHIHEKDHYWVAALDAYD